MPIIVHNGFIADTLYIQPGPGRAERPEAHGDAKDPVDLRPDRHEPREYVVGWQAWSGRRSSDLGRAAAQARDCNTAQEITSIHQPHNIAEPPWVSMRGIFLANRHLKRYNLVSMPFAYSSFFGFRFWAFTQNR